MLIVATSHNSLVNQPSKGLPFNKMPDRLEAEKWLLYPSLHVFWEPGQDGPQASSLMCKQAGSGRKLHKILSRST